MSAPVQDAAGSAIAAIGLKASGLYCRRLGCGGPSSRIYNPDRIGTFRQSRLNESVTDLDRPVRTHLIYHC